MTIPIEEFRVPEELEQQGFKRIAKEGSTIAIQWQNFPLRFDIYKSWRMTRKALQGATKNILTDEVIQKLELFISDQYLKLVVDEASSKVNNTTEEDATCPVAPNETPPERMNIPSEEWAQGLLDRYEKVKELADGNFPGLWQPLGFALSLKSILNIKGCTLPFAGIVLGAPSSYKTLAIDGLRPWKKQTFYTDKFTAKAFVSHATSVSKEELAEVDMLPKIKNKLLLTPELGPLFAARDDDLVENLGILTRILDGHGYECDSGAHGHRGYTGEWMFVLLGAAVDIPRKVHRYLGTLGPKLYYYRIPQNRKTEEQYLQQLKSDDFSARFKLVQESLLDYLKWFDAGPDMTWEDQLPKMQWNPEKDDPDALAAIIKLAKLLARLRGVIPTWETRDPQSSGADYAYSIPTIEEPDRAMTQLRNLARGHALSQGRNYIQKEDLGIVVKVVMSTAMIERVKVFDLLVKHKGILTTSQITHALNTTNPTARKTMTEFKALGLVTMEEIRDENNNSVNQIELKPEFQWFLGEEFQELRRGFELADFEGVGVEGQEGGLKGITPPSQPEQHEQIENPHDQEKQYLQQLFDQTCDELSGGELSSNNGMIEHSELHKRLVTSGKFTAGEATQTIIEHMRSGYLEKVDWNLYRKRR